MSVLMIVINILLILIAIVLIVAVLLQQGQRQGLGAIGGGAETFFGKNKAKGYEGKLLLVTKIGAAVFVVLAIAMTIITSHLDDGSDATDAGTTVVEHDHDGDGVADHGDDAHVDETEPTNAPETEPTNAPETEPTAEPAS